MILMFSMVSSATFGSVTAYKDLLPQGYSIALVGTKTDMDPKVVSYEHGLHLAKAMRAGYFHVSNRDSSKVNGVFEYFLSRYLSGLTTISPEVQVRESISVFYRRWEWIWARLVCGGRRKR